MGHDDASTNRDVTRVTLPSATRGVCSGQAVAPSFLLRIGQKATLMQKQGASAYGMLFALTHGEMQALYAGFEAYRPEPILSHLLNG